MSAPARPLRLLYCGSGWLPLLDEVRPRLPAGATLARWDRARSLAACVADIDVLLPSDGGASAEVIAAAPRLRLIQQPAAGTDGIDLVAAAARGIPVCNAPGANHVAVAEHALLLLLLLARRVPAALRAFAAREVGAPAGLELGGRTLGVVGLGRSGTALAERARALGMAVRVLGRGAVPAERAAFFAGCHAVSLHCPLTAETRGLVDDAALRALPRGALIVNCARGAVIDRAALVRALAADHLGGVGLDVHWEEPADPGDPLYADPRVIALPHVAGSTVEAFARIAATVADNLDRLARGAPLRHRVN
jgi:phosphoglycerate dehydrogenase-like enzyme